MFKFGFVADDSEDKINEPPEIKELRWLESKEVIPAHICLTENVNSIKCGDVIIKYVCEKQIICGLKSKGYINNSLLSAEQSHSDLIKAIYEGGLKVWECTYDLLNFLNENNIYLKDKHILDLGCGAGIIGLFSCLKGAKAVFQDYNEEVIKFVTIPNASLNNIKFDNCSFYCGDWKYFLDLLQKTLKDDDKFDYIFTSETIYNTENYKKLLDIFAKLLKRSGIIFLASKYYYFGVGGGIGQFEDMLKREDIFNYSTCWMCSEGVKRAIIKITLK